MATQWPSSPSGCARSAVTAGTDGGAVDRGDGPEESAVGSGFEALPGEVADAGSGDAVDSGSELLTNSTPATIATIAKPAMMIAVRTGVTDLEAVASTRNVGAAGTTGGRAAFW